MAIWGVSGGHQYCAFAPLRGDVPEDGCRHYL
jgi:hypothetical protein